MKYSLTTSPSAPSIRTRQRSLSRKPKKNITKPTNMTQDEINDISVAIVNHLVELKLVPDCTDTDDETEFYYQDAIRTVLAERYNVAV